VLSQPMVAQKQLVGGAGLAQAEGVPSCKGCAWKPVRVGAARHSTFVRPADATSDAEHLQKAAPTAPPSRRRQPVVLLSLFRPSDGQRRVGPHTPPLLLFY